MRIYLNVDGMEALLRGRELWSWHYIIQLDDREPPLEKYIEVACVEVRTPSLEECVQPVLKRLKEKEEEIKQEAFDELQEVEKRRNEIMMVGYSQ